MYKNIRYPSYCYRVISCPYFLFSVIHPSFFGEKNKIIFISLSLLNHVACCRRGFFHYICYMVKLIYYFPLRKDSTYITCSCILVSGGVTVLIKSLTRSAINSVWKVGNDFKIAEAEP